MSDAEKAAQRGAKPWQEGLRQQRESTWPFEDHSTRSLQQKLKSGALTERTAALVRAELARRHEPENSN